MAHEMRPLIVKKWDGQPISEPGIYSHVPIEVYHSGKLCAGPSISSSGLRTIFNKSPMTYYVDSPHNPFREEEEEGDVAAHYILGRAAHHLLLGEADFARQFVIRPAELNGKAWNSNRTDCKEWLEHVAGLGLTVLKGAQVEAVKGMAGLLPWQKGLEDSGLANSAIGRDALGGLVEHTIVAIHKETGVYLLSRPDAIPLDSAQGSDFKTTVEVDDNSLERTLNELRYDMQADLSSLCLEQATDGLRFGSFGLVFAMKAKPHAVRVIELRQGDLEEAAADNDVAIRTFARCVETNRWPGPGGTQTDAVYMGRTSWALERAKRRREFLEAELAA